MLYALPEVLRLTTLGKSVLYNLIRQGLFPRAVKIPGVRRSAWRAEEVQAWISKLESHNPAIESTDCSTNHCHQ